MSKNSFTKIFTIDELDKTFLFLYTEKDDKKFVEITEIVFDEESNVYIQPLSKELEDFVIKYIKENIN